MIFNRQAFPRARARVASATNLSIPEFAPAWVLTNNRMSLEQWLSVAN